MAMQFEEGKAYLVGESQRIEELLKKSITMNSYILFGLLKQMSKWGLAKIQQSFMKTFFGISESIA